jgi:hypothetical protein
MTDIRTRKRASVNLLFADEFARLQTENFARFTVCLRVNESLFCFNDKKALVGELHIESTEESAEFDLKATVFNMSAEFEAEVDEMGVELERFATEGTFLASDFPLSTTVICLVRGNDSGSLLNPFSMANCPAGVEVGKGENSIGRFSSFDDKHNSFSCLKTKIDYVTINISSIL